MYKTFAAASIDNDISQNIKLHLFPPYFIYADYLSLINDIAFTKREIDVVSYFLRGRSAKATSSFLGLSPKTVDVHVRNILLKINKNSREGLIDFFENSESQPYLKIYQEACLLENKLKEALKTISKDIPHYFSKEIIIAGPSEFKTLPFVKEIFTSLTSCGISPTYLLEDNFCFENPKDEEKKSVFPDLFIISASFLKNFLDKNAEKSLRLKKNIHDFSLAHPQTIFLTFDDPTLFTKALEIKNPIISFSNPADYYFSLIDLMKRLSPSLVLEPLIELLNSKSESSFLYTPPTTFSLVNEEDKKHPSKKETLRYQIRKKFSFFAISGGLFVLGSFLLLYGDAWRSFLSPTFFHKKTIPLPADSFLPSNFIIPDIFLKREMILQKILYALKQDKNPIKVIALIGIGGVGKTTLARYYAKNYKDTLLRWEFNAESKETLLSSFIELAHVLSKNPEDRKKLREILELKNFHIKNQSLLFFVKNQLNALKNWVLIYDNLDSMEGIEQFIPNDASTWGQGEVIITSRNENIQNNPFIQNSLIVDVLTPDECFNLFHQLISNDKTEEVSSTEIGNMKHFLKSVPPYPLDISIAAFYLKATNTTYEQYTKHLLRSSQDFSSIQEKILGETSDYKKTRYGIISLSIEHILSLNKEFKDLLLILGLLGSENISRELLEKFQSSLIVDDFIYNLNKHSLLLRKTNNKNLDVKLSIHRSIQEMILIYLSEKYNINLDKNYFKRIVDTINNYANSIMDDEHFGDLQNLKNHYEAIINKQILENQLLTRLENVLACINFYIGDRQNAQKIFLKSIPALQHYYGENDPQLPWAYAHLGDVCRKLGEFNSSLDYFTKSLALYEKYFPNHSIEIAWTTARLANLYREKDQYEKSIYLYEKSLPVIESTYGKHHPKVAWVYTNLGDVHRKMAHYTEARNFFQKSIEIYKSLPTQNSFRIAWVSGYLASLEADLGYQKEAKKLFEEITQAYLKLFSQDYEKIAWIYVHIGMMNERLGNLSKAQDFINKGIGIYKKKFKEGHYHIAWAESHLLPIYHKRNQLKEAELLFQRIRPIFEKKYGKSHFKFAHLINKMAKIYLSLGNIDAGEELLTQSTAIVGNSSNRKVYFLYKNLADLFIKKAERALMQGDIKQASNLITQSREYTQKTLEQSLCYPKDSPRFKKIQSSVHAIRFELDKLARIIDQQSPSKK